VAAWFEIVEQVERGYCGIAEEYRWLHLAVRDTLGRAVEDLRPRDRHWLLRGLIPIDRRFTAATEEAPDRRRPLGRRKRPWWRSRVPSRRVHLTRRDHQSDPTDLDWPPLRPRWVPMRPVSPAWPDPDGNTSGWWSAEKDVTSICGWRGYMAAQEARKVR
jgi:hypothetical protein